MNDDDGDAPLHRRASTSAFGSQIVADIVMGLAFYSRIPMPANAHEPPELNRIAMALPFTSLAIGAAPALLLVLLAELGLPGIFAAGIAVSVLMILTGAMAEDGLADAADGLFGGATTTRRLEIMRDHTHGTYGIVALVMFLLLRVVAIGAIAAISPLAAAGAWLAAMVLSRSGSLWLAVVLPPARTDGLSAAVGGVTRRAFLLGAVFAVIFALLLAGSLGGPGALVAILAVTAACAWGGMQLAKHLLGGQTGDVIGALQALIELAVLAVLLGFA